MTKRKTKSEKNALPEGPDAKRKKEKDTRDKDLATEGSDSFQNSTSKVNSKATSKATPKASTAKDLTTKDSSSRSSTLRSSTTRASTSKPSTHKGSSNALTSVPKASNSSSKASTSKASNSKKEKKTKNGKSPSNPTVVPLSSSASKSSSLQRKKPTKTKDPKDTQGHYMSTLDNVAPPKEEPQGNKGITLSDDELGIEIGDEAIEIFDSGKSSLSFKIFALPESGFVLAEEERNKVKFGSDQDEDMHSEEESSSHDMDVGHSPDDNMIVKDATKPAKTQKKKKKKKNDSSSKVLESDFDNVDLPRLGKSSVRLAICIHDMWPKEEEPNLDLFTEELGKMGNREVLQSLKEITSSPDPNEVKALLKIMNYGSSQVHSDINKVVRILIAQFYCLSVSKEEEAREAVADRVKWLLHKNRYHQEVDLDARTYTGGPFSTPLIGQILRAYFVDSPSQQDIFLIKHMKKQRKVPLRLIVMITALIDHGIREWQGGSRVKIHLTRPNAEDTYRNLWKVIKIAKKKAKTYLEDLEIDLYNEMMSDNFGDDEIPEYDYNTLEAEAQARRRARQSLKDPQDDNDDSSSNASGSDKGSDTGSDNGSDNGSDDNDSDHGSDGDNGSGNENDQENDNGRNNGGAHGSNMDMDNDGTPNKGSESNTINAADSFDKDRVGEEAGIDVKGKGKEVAGRGD
ncbi:hypothetical protein EV361DRAFT_955884 [Lentinula raphanica]|nr:hypothetical protein EV361DRAFT_955884 [Lentinula raphanica]